MGHAIGVGAIIAHCCSIWRFVVINKFRPHRLSLTHFSKVGTRLTSSAGAVQFPQDSQAQRPCCIDLHGPTVLTPTPLQTPWAYLLIEPSSALINVCLLQQVEPFIRNGGRGVLSKKRKSAITLGFVMVKGEMHFFGKAAKTHFEATDGFDCCPPAGSRVSQFLLTEESQKGRTFPFLNHREACFVLEACLLSVHVCMCIYIGMGSREIFGQR